MLACLLVGCATSSPVNQSNGSTGTKKIAVVAAENFWGSIAAQVGGDRVSVHSIIANPDADPHDYEPTAADGRALADAQYVIENGVGYDPWVAKLVAANATPDRAVLNVGQLVRVKEGGNPHRWYSPDDVHRVIEQICAATSESTQPTQRILISRNRTTRLMDWLVTTSSLPTSRANTVEHRSARRNRS
jgi:zinc/manganese transport system substrate-binding protein